MRLVGEDLTMAYGPVEVFRNLSCSFESGEATAVVGPSGTGKSTLLSLLGGLSSPIRGTVRIESEDGTTERLMENAAWVHQTTHALGQRSALDNAALGALARGLDHRRAEEEARRVLAAVGLEHRARLPANRLSGGEQQRLSVSRALALGAPFILADEPTGHLDKANSSVVIDLLVTEAAARGQGVVVATHDPEVAGRCHRTLDLAARPAGG